MIKIYRYCYSTQEWDNLINDPSLTGAKRKSAINDLIVKNGTEVSIKDYFNDGLRDNFIDKQYSYKCFGEPENCIERLALAEMNYDNELSYCTAKEYSPEDLCEERTDWSEMKDYADGLYYFILSLKREIAAGTIVTQNKNE